MYLQVDPYACLYRLEKGEQIKIIIESEVTSPSFVVKENIPTRILDLSWVDCEFYVMVNGERLHYTEYPANFTGIPD